MAEQTKYVPVPWLYDSIGLRAREAYDRCPPNSYIQLMNCLERDEHAMSSRYGTVIINRDPNGTVPNGQNYLFPSVITSLAKMSYQSQPQRYALLADGSVWQRNSNTQGPYTKLTLPLNFQGQQIQLSNQPATSLILPCYETSLPYLFIYDQVASIKIAAGSSTPELTGIDPSPYTLNTLPYAPLLLLIDDFPSTSLYSTANVSGWAWGNIETLDVESGALITDFSQFYGVGPSGGGTTIYNPSTTTTSVTANQTGEGNSQQNSSVLAGFPSVVPSLGEVVSITVQWDASASMTGPYTTAAFNLQYSIDGGVTWGSFAGGSLTAPGDLPPVGSITSSVSVMVANLSQLQIRAQAIAVVGGPSGSSVSATTNILNAYASISNPGAFGPVANGMLSILNNNTYVAIPIAEVTSTNFGTGVWTQYLIKTVIPSNLAPGDTFAIYASSNDLVDGFYEVLNTGASNTLICNVFPNQTTNGLGAAIGAVGGYLTYAANSASNYQPVPPACVLTGQYSSPYPPQISAFGFYEWVPPTQTSFPISAWSGTVTASNTGTVSKNITLDLNQNNQVTDDDLIVLTLLVSAPDNIAQVELQFFVGSGQNNYYTKLISPAYYQGAIAGTQLAYEATQQQILANTLGLITGQPPNSTSAQLQPSVMSTGAGSWQACLMRRGDFLPVGQAGQQGLDWANVTGWQISVTTNANGSSSFSVNGLYLQWGYGPSSFGGVGYDYRQTFYNAATGTESSPTQIQTYNQDYGYLASQSAPFYLRQAAQIIGQYSPDPQDTHVRLYRRGGILAENWVQVLQIPNVSGFEVVTTFVAKDTIADAFVEQAQPLVLDNDPPVTSSLVTPIQTTLAAATTGPGTSIYNLFSPQLIQVVDSSSVFVPNQIVDIGNANNLEQVAVISGGTGQFTAILRLAHNQGEPVAVYAVPRQPCSLCCIVNLPGGATQVLLAGDANNPGRVYYSKPGLPENFGPQNYLDVGSATDPVMALINWRGTALIATQASWYVFVGGSQPYPQPTGATHGIVASGGWTLTEGTVWFQAADGEREFSGADGKYMTLPVEWIFRTNPECIPPQANPALLSQTVMAFYNNQVFNSYVQLGGDRRFRLIYDTNYQRFRQDDLMATAMLWERDTNQFLVGTTIVTASNTVGFAVVLDQQYNQDYDDGGWNTASDTLVQTPINLTIQRPYNDLGRPHFPKQWNVLEGDYNTQGQPIQTTLLFNTEPPTSLVLPAMNTGTVREKVQYTIPAVASASNPLASGVQAYSMSILHTMAVTVAPTLFQEDIYAQVLADYRASWDSYWQGAEGDLLGILPKNGYFDYTTETQLTVSMYADGNDFFPYYVDTFTLIPQQNRSVVRVQFPARKGRLWRCIVTTSGPFQLWAPARFELKPLEEGSGYEERAFPIYQ